MNNFLFFTEHVVGQKKVYTSQLGVAMWQSFGQ